MISVHVEADKNLSNIMYVVNCKIIIINIWVSSLCSIIACHALTIGSFYTTLPSFSQGGDDFVSQQYQLDFPAGQTRAEFTVVITDDSLIEATESFQLLLSIPEDLISKGVQVGPNSASTVTIMDNDGELYGIHSLHMMYCIYTMDYVMYV